MMRPAWERCADILRQLQHLLKCSSVTQGAFAGALDHRPVGHRIAERDAEFDDIRARFNGRESYVSRGRKIGIAAGEVGDE